MVKYTRWKCWHIICTFCGESRFIQLNAIAHAATTKMWNFVKLSVLWALNLLWKFIKNSIFFLNKLISTLFYEGYNFSSSFSCLILIRFDGTAHKNLYFTFAFKKKNRLFPFSMPLKVQHTTAFVRNGSNESVCRVYNLTKRAIDRK